MFDDMLKFSFKIIESFNEKNIPYSLNVVELIPDTSHYFYDIPHESDCSLDFVSVVAVYFVHMK
jgi:hypothetical protein